MVFSQLLFDFIPLSKRSKIDVIFDPLHLVCMLFSLAILQFKSTMSTVQHRYHFEAIFHIFYFWNHLEHMRASHTVDCIYYCIQSISDFFCHASPMHLKSIRYITDSVHMLFATFYFCWKIYLESCIAFSIGSCIWIAWVAEWTFDKFQLNAQNQADFKLSLVRRKQIDSMSLQLKPDSVIYGENSLNSVELDQIHSQ